MLPNSKEIFPSRSNSVEFIHALPSIDNAVKILVYSALCYDIKIQQKAIALGADACLIKTCSIEIFTKTIKALLQLDVDS